MTKKTYIAAVVVICHVAGVRTDVQPGQPVPEDLPQHDIEQLLAMKAIVEPDAEAQAEKDAKAAKRTADKPFKDAKAAVQAADASTKSVGDAGAGTDKPGA